MRRVLAQTGESNSLNQNTIYLLHLLHRVHDTRFDTEWRSRGCANTDLVSHKQSVEEMRSKQYSLVSRGTLCERETVARRAYEYNWKVPPSKCCPREQGKT